MSTYKEVDLFGNESIRFVDRQNKKRDLFTEYDEFLDKFEAKKTTDDCYTPDDVYQLVLSYVDKKCDISGRVIIRPFYPGGDYEAIDYSSNCVVIDNPPFSIISSIAKFYINKGVPFFLFAPHLTLFSSDIDCTHIVVGGDIVYQNGATVKTSFLTNMLGDIKILGDSELFEEMKKLNKSKANPLPRYKYPDSVITVSAISWIVEKGVSIEIKKGHTKHWRGLDAQKPHGKAIFGSGFLVSDKAAADKAAADKAAADKAAADKAAADKAAAGGGGVIEWQLSRKELDVIKSLG
jgi:hypothetical protein